jgi:hypothetical protein
MQLSENNGEQSRTSSLYVSLAGADGRVLGGAVAGMLTAASAVQVLLLSGPKFESGSFLLLVLKNFTKYWTHQMSHYCIYISKTLAMTEMK